MSTQPSPLSSQDPVAFAMTHKDRVKAMPPEIQLRLVDALFRRFMVPKFMKSDPGINVDDLAQLRVKFAQNLLDIPGSTGPYERHKDPDPKKGVIETGKGLAKSGYEGMKAMIGSPVATAEGAAAGALGDLKSLSEAIAFFDRTDLKHDKLQQAIVNSGNKLYSDAQKRNPVAADIGASLGKQGPSMAAASGIGDLIGPTKGIIGGAAKGMVEMAAYNGMQGKDTTGMDLAIGAFFPLLGKVFSRFGKEGGVSEKAVKEVSTPKEANVRTEGVGSAPTSSVQSGGKIQNLADQVAQEKFKKNFKDLSPQERTQMPQAMNDKLKAIATERRAAKVTARKEAKKAAAEISDLKTKMDSAKAEQAKQVAARKAKPMEQAAVVTKAAEENPQMSKAASAVTKAAEPPKPVAEPVKVPEGEHGTGKIAQQAKDRERISKVRETSVRTKQMESLEQQARELVGRVSSANLQNVPIPELEEAANELPDPHGVIKGMMKMRRAGKYSMDNDDVYRTALMEWILKGVTN